MDYEQQIQSEKEAFDRQAIDREKNGFVPDLQGLVDVPWFYNNAWRDPKIAEIQIKPRIDFIIEFLKKTIPGGRVLEIGCGTGLLSLELSRNNFDVLGLDVSPKNIEVAKKYANRSSGKLDYLACDALNFTPENEKYDAVVFFRSFHHFENLQKLVENIRNWLAPGGKLAISEPVRGEFTENSAIFGAVLRACLPTWIGFEEKLKGKWDFNEVQKQVDEIFSEYTFDDHHHQSEMDNKTDTKNEILNALSQDFKFESICGSDAFIDKLIGGLRGPNRYELARYLKGFDQYLVDKGILPATSLELSATLR